MTTTALQKRTNTVGDFLETNRAKIANALPKHISATRMLSVVMNSIEKTPDLNKCTLDSLLACVLTSSSLGIEPDGVLGQAYIIPYENKQKKCFEAQFQIGYKGLIALARRSGVIESLSAQPVFANDKFDYEYGLNEKLVHRPADGERGPLKYAYAIAKFKDGGHHFEVMTKTDILKIKNASMGANSKFSPWTKWPEEMWRKTAAKKLCKFLPMAVELSRVALQDEEDDMGLKEANVTPMTMVTDSNKNDLTDRLTAREEGTIPPAGSPIDSDNSELADGDFRSELFGYAKKNDCEAEIPTVLLEMGFANIDDVDKDSEQMVLDYFKKTFKKDK